MKLLLCLLISIFLSAQESKWSVDKAHASVNFTITHLLISEVSGQFTKFDGFIMANGEDFEGAKAELTIESNSVFTNQDYRDKDLRSEGFFNVEKYPTLKFVSTSFKKVSDKNFKVMGNFTMKGVTKEIELDAKLLGIIERRGKKVAGFKITGIINRKDFNVGAKTPAAVVSEEIMLTINAELKLN